MKSSAKVVNYEVRPCKFVERRLFLNDLSRIVFEIGGQYQYIGFGGLAFTDFKLFHKEMNISSMYSIEHSCPDSRLSFNNPLSCIKVVNKESEVALREIPFSCPSIVWLDYDGFFTPNRFNDIDYLLSKLSHGSVIIISCNRQLSEDGSSKPLSNKAFKEKYKEFAPSKLEKQCCAEKNTPYTLRQMLERFCTRKLKKRNDAKNTNLEFKPLYNIIYQDSDAKMYTYGGIILDKTYDSNKIFNHRLEILNPDTLLEITIPNLTLRETLLMSQIINDKNQEDSYIGNKMFSQKDIEKFRKFYRFMPNYYDVRI